MMTPGALPAAKRRSAGGGLHTSPRHRFAISSIARTARGTEKCTTVLKAEPTQTSWISPWVATLIMRTWRNGSTKSNETSVTCASVTFFDLSRSEGMNTVEIQST